ncbi:MAG: hypothetical protein IJH07_10730 [Ruminococcus sp.]|nr:hypothetical protein [Ruminococcus sp.]
MEKKSIDVILERLPERMQLPLRKVRSAVEDKATEIVLRTDRALCIYEANKQFYVTESGCLTDSCCVEGLVYSTSKEIEQTVMRLCDYSVYTHQHEINSGYITIENGVRVGLCGKAVMGEGKVANIRDIGTLSFRIARDIHHCSDELLKKLVPPGGVLICGAPGSGKTTLIRDMARQLSYRCRVSLLDERGELSAFSRGKNGFPLGLCDVYAGYPKGFAANCAIRSMSPAIIVCDEMGNQNDVELLLYSVRCGVTFIATVHAASMSDLRNRKITSDMINTGAFRYIVFIGGNRGVGSINKIYEMCDKRA